MTLRKHEKKTLFALKSTGESSVKQLVKETGLAHAAVMRAALSLREKGLIKLEEEVKTIAKLNDEGKNYAEKGLPERRMIEALAALSGKAPVEDVLEEASLDKKLLKIGIGWLHKKGWAVLDGNLLDGRGVPSLGSDEKLLQLIKKRGRVTIEDLNDELKKASSVLKRRKLAVTVDGTTRTLKLTAAGNEILSGEMKGEDEVSLLTTELIITGKWKKTKFRSFDVSTPGPAIYPGKPHPVQQVIQRVKEIFLEMGFTEIRGSIVETAFWNFDALFQPQDHPAREMMDTFYLASPQKGELPEKNVVDNVACTHENGWTTGSKGWGYRWSPEEAKKLILRTHTTAATIRYLAENKQPPIKVFSVDRIFRNEKLDFKHLAELYQVEGIIMDRAATFRDLIGTMKKFYSKLGLQKVQFWPSYFPYTEPSAQSTVYVPEIGEWVELCGMGMFRPEVLAPFNIKHPVLAWGGGLERLVMLKLGVEDIRFLYKNDLGWIRRTSTYQ